MIENIYEQISFENTPSVPLNHAALRFLNPLNVTKVNRNDDVEGINNFDIFVIQEGAKTPGLF